MRPSRVTAERHGRAAEAIAVARLRLKGYRLIARNVRNGAGEVDALFTTQTEWGEVLVAVEVKFRADLASAHAAVETRSLHRISEAALAFQRTRPDLSALPLRVDAVFLIGPTPWRARFHHEPDYWRDGWG